MGLQGPQDEDGIAHDQQDLLGRKRAVIFLPSPDLVTAVKWEFRAGFLYFAFEANHKLWK